MDYKTKLTGAGEGQGLPGSLLEHLQIPEVGHPAIEYLLPEMRPMGNEPLKKTPYSRKHDNLRLPSRLNYPLLPYHEDIKEAIITEEIPSKTLIHSHHLWDLKTLSDVYKLIISKNPELDAKKTFNINDLKHMSELKYGFRAELIHLSAASFANQASKVEQSIIMNEESKESFPTPTMSKYMSLLCSVQRLRMFIAKSTSRDKEKFEGALTECNEPEFKMVSDATYIYWSKNTELTFVLVMTPGHFRLYHSGIKAWFCGPSSYFNYMYTIADILNNLSVISSMPEYYWLDSMYQILLDLMSYNFDHLDVTDFMKSLEGLLLNLSDYDESYLMNWQPILECLDSMHELDQKFIGETYPFTKLCEILHNPKLKFKLNSPLMRILQLRGINTRSQLQELSSLHKFIFYAEINCKKGLNKYLKRVHTARSVEPDAINKMTWMARKLFFLSYSKKHNTMPTILGDEEKSKYLHMRIMKKDYKSIELLPLHWWENIVLYNCMDNTSTEDALEFAKDKGALKNEIKLGPGDSRKELLQVIEKTDYKLKKFFPKGGFSPKEPCVRFGYQLAHCLDTDCPVRLIPKEREQKPDGRFFANGELSNKHALSVIALKMKKILSYFDEQLMTPMDKKRKELLHKAAQDLKQKDTYSLMLDIEGHNQSMQYSNTSQLSEFCGQLFGESDWACLPHYFSQLDIYHYDEYIDDVMITQGQLGGIEGWLNPLWTLHTTLMMKLLRVMTDLEIETIMVYSDDVNALLKIRQATTAGMEATFLKITRHCAKFGMMAKMGQTNLSKHRVTMLRQHYADGERADATLKKLISTSGGNNPMVFSESIEVSGICSSISSALEMTNHTDTCIYLKNYKIAVLLARLPYMILSNPQKDNILSMDNLPPKLVTLLCQIKDDTTILSNENSETTLIHAINDISSYLGIRPQYLNKNILRKALVGLYSHTVDKAKFMDQADRLLYLQIYDKFIFELLFYWTYMPVNLGGLGGSLTINLLLSGHSSGTSKSLHYMKAWVDNFCKSKDFFYNYLVTNLSVSPDMDVNFNETRLLKSYWPSEMKLTDPVTSISQAIKSMIKYKTKNVNVLKLITLDESYENISSDLVNIFRHNFHPRMAQFYYENTSVHFLDLLISKIETSSGLLTSIRSLTRLRNSLCTRTMQNIRIAGTLMKTSYGEINKSIDIIGYLINRRIMMFPKLSIHEIDEPLYDNKLVETSSSKCLITVRKCSPMHFENGIKVFDLPDMGNEIRYKGELLDDDRMITNKEELLAAKLSAVTKWLITKLHGNTTSWKELDDLDCVKACNLALATLTGQKLSELWNYSPNETGGEILHRIPNMRFNSTTYIRAESNMVLTYTADLNQQMIIDRGWVDSNINFDYLRLRLLLLMTIRGKYNSHGRVVTRWNCDNSNTIQDVQFIRPMYSSYNVTSRYPCYGSVRGHVFNELRFRYMATQYLNVEDLHDLYTIPNISEKESSAILMDDLLAEVTLNYAYHLDREYMRQHFFFFDSESWQPLKDKLSKIDWMFKEFNNEQQMDLIRSYLSKALVRNRRIRLIDMNDRTAVSLQLECLDYLRDQYPLNDNFEEMAANQLAVLKDPISNLNKTEMIRHFQNRFSIYDDLKQRSAAIIATEFLLTFWMSYKVDSGVAELNIDKILNTSISYEVSMASLMILDPLLNAKMHLVGCDLVLELIGHQHELIYEILNEISRNVQLIDVVIPQKLPSLGVGNPIPSDTIIPEVAKACDYTIIPISLTCMKTIDQLSPLLDYARKCTDIAADPAVYYSPTGSDSFVSQYSLFKLLLQEGYIYTDTKICDITGGRGDGAFALSSHNLTYKTFSRQDTFTSVYFHPEVIFDRDYDIFKTDTLKQFESFEWVHCDISFVGSDKRNIIDFILFLEERNIAYSIRLNSVSLSGYELSALEDIPMYDHFLCHPEGDNFKPYQVYLVGMPSDNEYTDNIYNIKQSIAYRSIALSYSKLIKKENLELSNWTDIPNSSTIYLGDHYDQRHLIKTVVEETLSNNSKYYLKRYLDQSEFRDTFWIVPESLDPSTTPQINNFLMNSNKVTMKVYTGLTPEDIGDVSKKSMRFHVDHLTRLQESIISKIECKFSNLKIPELIYFSRHPISQVRATMESVYRLKSALPNLDLNDRTMMKELLKDLKSDETPSPSRNQLIYQDSIRLMVLSSSLDDYSYGVRFLHSSILQSKLPSNNLISRIKNYRSISHMFRICKQMVKEGIIKNHHIVSIKDTLVTRRVKKRNKITINPRILPQDDIINKVTEGIDIDFSDILVSLEAYALNPENTDDDDGIGLLFKGLDDRESLLLDINISKAVDTYLATHGRIEEDKFGRIMLDEEYYEDPEI